MTDKIRSVQGKVVSDKMEKSFVVAIERKVNTLYMVNLSVVQLNYMYTMRTMKPKLVIP